MIGEADQSRPLPVATLATEGERAVVEAGAMPEPRAAPVETHPGAENRVEKPRADPAITLGLEHAEVVLARVLIEGNEPHAARAHAGDSRQVDRAAALLREFHERPGAQLLG